jgi:hypothetical protein
MTALSTGAYYLKRGDTFDPEDSRMTNRLHSARSILDTIGIVPTVTHCDACKEGLAGGGCWDACKTTWTEWVTDEMFQSAFNLADAAAREYGNFNMRRINTERVDKCL